MTSYTDEKLYRLLPEIYQVRDAEGGQPLRALINVLAEQAALVEQDIANLYDNWFIETADEWIAPYIGDLIGVRGLHLISSKTFSRRAQVANTLSYRRRKGTATMLEQLAHDTTGWEARVVEFFERLQTTQHFNHLRPNNVCTPDLRLTNQLELVNTAFETAAHTVDVRHISNLRGKYNIPNIGIFLWRLQAYPILQGDAFAHGSGRFSFSSLGNNLTLFNVPQTEQTIAHLAEEINIPDRLRRRALYDDLEAVRRALVDNQAYTPVYFNQQPVFQLYLPGEPDPIPSIEILICNLSTWRRPPAYIRYTAADGSLVRRSITVAVDPVTGRIAFRTTNAPASLRVSYAYGFSGDLGGGPYDRRRVRSQHAQASNPDTIADPDTFESLILIPSAEIDTIDDALKAWDASTPRTVIQIEDSRTYKESLTINMAGTELVIQARNGQCPTLLGAVRIQGGADTSRLTLNGLLIAGQVSVVYNLAELNVNHSTLVPGDSLTQNGDPRDATQASIVVDASSDQLRLTIDHSIVGPLELPVNMTSLTIRNSIVDAPQNARAAIAASDDGTQPGPATTLERVTIFGNVHVEQFDLVSDTIFTEPAIADRRQVGCVRFSFLPKDSQVPRRYHCEPEHEIQKQVDQARKINPGLPQSDQDKIDAEVRAWLLPTFTSRRYGQPGYAQVALTSPAQIRSGASDEAEMGAFNFLQQPQREANLRSHLNEYLRFGLEAGIFFAT